MAAKKLTLKMLNHNSEMLEYYAEKGDVEEVKRLMPISNPKTSWSWPLVFAVMQGHKDIVEFLLPYVTPNFNDCWAFKTAIRKGNTEIIDLIYVVTDIDLAIEKSDEATVLLIEAYRKKRYETAIEEQYANAPSRGRVM
ncbi:ankyrin repeat domain-containing protein [Stenotrophomonas acidaminiphila]